MPRSSKKTPTTRSQRVGAALKKPVTAIRTRSDAYLARRPHRSFRVTRRRDYKRSLKLPGYFSFTFFVNKTLWKYRKIFIWLAVFYAAMTIIFVGIGSQETYASLTATLKDASNDIFQGDVSQIGQAALVFLSISSGGLTSDLTAIQQVFVVIVGLLVWLTTVWLLRNLLAGHRVKMRDGLYSAGSPIISTLIVVIFFAVQLIPIGVVVVAYTAATGSGLLAGGVETMLFWCAAALLTVTSLYWTTSTFFAMIIVTLPGMYPGKALRTAGDIVTSRRLRILLRILWMFGAIGVSALLVMIPVILVNQGLVNLWSWVSNVPVVPTALMLFGVVSFIWGASYIYLLYRRVVDDDAKPA